ncbi:MAG: hypothetical protein M4579_003438 [Chaenotheca gracillima]|nr:MAG: hypothetical protein M4579_003438 [Chaenotheca gracillima]
MSNSTEAALDHDVMDEEKENPKQIPDVSLLFERFASTSSPFSDWAEYCPESRPILIQPLTNRENSPSMFHDLPLDVLWIIIPLLNFNSLARLRLVNYQTKVTVEAFPVYKDVVTHASAVLRVMSKTRLHFFYSAGLLFELLKNPKCVVCNNLGPFLFLLDLKRVCLACLMGRSWDIRVHTMTVARFAFDMDDYHNPFAPHIPQMQGPLDLYDFAHNSESEGQLVSLGRARTLGIELKGSEKAMLEHRENVSAERSEAYDEEMTEYVRDLEYGEVNFQPAYPVNPEVLLEVVHNNFSRNTSTPFPWIDKETGRVENTFWCLGCTTLGDLPYDDQEVDEPETDIEKCARLERFKAYTERSIMDHLRICDAAHDLWEEAKLDRGSVSS